MTVSGLFNEEIVPVIQQHGISFDFWLSCNVTIPAHVSSWNIWRQPISIFMKPILGYFGISFFLVEACNCIGNILLAENTGCFMSACYHI